VSVCLSAGISKKPHGRTSPNFQFELTAAVALSFSSGIAIYYYLLPVSWRHHTAYFYVLLSGETIA